MSTAKSLSDEQIATIRGWAESGEGLSEIQKLLDAEMEVKVTYLETRFLLDDLGIELKPEPKPEPEPEPEEEGTDEEPTPVDEIPGGDSPGPGSVTVSVDKVQRPGAIVSGRASFAGGQGAAWWLDQMGRLGFDPDDSDFRPSEEETIAFQTELQAAIQKGGF